MSKRASRFIAGIIDGDLTIHIPNAVADYDTLCGIDFCDSSIGHGGTIDVPKGAKVDCITCRNIWAAAKGYRARDFELKR